MTRSCVRPGILLLVPALALAFAVPARGHYHMLFPQAAAGQREQSMSFLYQWGHPFEHQLFDAQAPEKLLVFGPDGKPSEVAKNIQKVEARGEGGKSIAAYSFAYTPPRRGDYTVVLAAPPAWLEEEKLFVHDSVKVVLHVQTQNGWDTATGQPFEVVPLTRPYGLQPGIAFQAQVIAAAKPLAGAMVEVERYNATAPKDLPPDEQITRRVKADPNGVFTATLTDAGWWCVTAERDGGMRERNGKMYPVRQRATLWVFVDDAPKPVK
jgi:cobalt/nickel transport protein